MWCRTAKSRLLCGTGAVLLTGYILTLFLVYGGHNSASASSNTINRTTKKLDAETTIPIVFASNASIVTSSSTNTEFDTPTTMSIEETNATTAATRSTINYENTECC